MKFRDNEANSICSEVIKHTFPLNYEIHVFGRGLDIREFKLPYINIENVVSSLLRDNGNKHGYRDYLIWELRWVDSYQLSDLAVLCGMTISGIRRILSRIDKLVRNNQDKWWNGEVIPVDWGSLNDMETNRPH